MGFKSFLELVEIRTKLASFIPFLTGTVYAMLHFKRFNQANVLVLFISLFAFDMVTTALNNYFDMKRASKRHGYNYETHNTIIKDRLSESAVLAVIMALLGTAVLFGIILFFKTNVIILLIGILSFAVGICYSFGPVPISRTPLGEALSGFFMGFIIVFLSIYIHIYDLDILSIAYGNNMLSIRLEPVEIFYMLLVAFPTMFLIANIMLANNICDMEDDLENRRYTLPIYIGRKNALLLFKSLNYAALLDIAIISILGVVPLISLFSLLTWIPVNKNIKLFYETQTKKDTFALSVKNFMLISGTFVVLLWIAWMLNAYKFEF